MAEKNIDAILQRLIRILSQEIVTYTKLLTSLEEKQQAIIQGQIENMKIITEQEQVILTDAKLTERERNISIANLRTNTDEMKDLLKSWAPSGITTGDWRKIFSGFKKDFYKNFK